MCFNSFSGLSRAHSFFPMVAQKRALAMFRMAQAKAAQAMKECSFSSVGYDNLKQIVRY